MIHHRIIVAVFLLLFASGLCWADTLVITYRSGKTQTVVLDEPSATINSWQFVGGTTAAPPLQPYQQHQAAPAAQEASKPANAKTEAKPAEKPAEKKSNIRFQWNAPPIKD